MQREIKFRGWHTTRKQMFSAAEMGADQLTILPSTGEFINVSGSNTRLSQILPRDEFIALQYIGLKDKNGTEIYESDLVCWEHYVKQIGTVVWDGYRWGIDGFWIPKQDEPSAPFSEDVEFEVIGNIYENKELLND